MTHTGPNTEAGKAVSKLNAVKTGYHVKAILPWEDANAIALERQRLHEQWSGPDPTSQELVNQLHSVQLRIRRLEHLEFEHVTSRMYVHSTRVEFCTEAGLDPERAGELPDWFFDGSQAGRDEAQRLLVVYDELVAMDFYDPDLHSHTKRKRYPNASKEMIRKRGETRITLEKRLRKLSFEEGANHVTPDMFLMCFEQEYLFELFWAKNPQRCDSIVRGLRASIALHAQSSEPWGRTMSSLFRQQRELLQALAVLKQARAMDFISQ